MIVEFTVTGMPQPQGSKSARVVNGRAIITEGFGDGPRKRRSLRDAVAEEARRWSREHGNPPAYDGAVAIDLTFFMPRPKSAPKSRVYPLTKPDCSKLLRAVEDSLSKIIYTDDARVVEVVVRKLFAVDRAPGADVKVWAL